MYNAEVETIAKCFIKCHQDKLRCRDCVIHKAELSCDGKEAILARAYLLLADNYKALKEMAKIDPPWETCGFKHEGQFGSRREYLEWFDNHCAKCPFMSDICMYGE